MDGDVAPLADLAEIAGRYDAALIVDEAHALGTLGPSGAGLCRDAGIVPDALVGTLGKAFGAAGGFVAGSPELIQYLVNRARTFIFTTALPPGIAAAARTAIDLAQSPAGDVLRARLQDRIAQTCAGLGRPTVHGPIVPVILGSDSAALGASQSLASAGLFVQAIRPPTVAEGTARLRVTLSSSHTPQMVDRLTSALTHLLPRPPA